MDRVLNFEMVLDKSLSDPGSIARTVAEQLSRELAEELKPQIREAIVKNIDQMVKDVGKEIVIAGLRELLVKDNKNED